MIRFIFLLALLFPLVTACGQAQEQTHSMDTIRALLGTSTHQVLTQPTSLTAYLLNGWQKDPSTNGFSAYKVMESVEPVNRHQMKYLTELLGQADTYQLSKISKRCEFIPQAGFTFLKGQEEVKVLFSLDCAILQVIASAETAPIRVDIDPRINDFEDLFFQIFPNFQNLNSAENGLKDPVVPETVDTTNQEVDTTTGPEQRPLVVDGQEVVNESRIEYTVKQGDNLYRIAQEHQVTVANIKAWNNLTNDNIRRGQTLILYR